MKPHLLSMRKLALIGIASVCLSSLISCNKTSTQTESPASAPTTQQQTPDQGVKRYRLTGRVVAVDKTNKSLTVDGDDIPGFMSAMQMPYDVKDPSLMDKLAPGDKIAADVVVKGDDSWLENIKVTQPAPPTPKPTSILSVTRVSAA